MDRSVLRRIVTLAILAPDIFEAIVRGEEPCGLPLFCMFRKFGSGYNPRVAAGLGPVGVSAWASERRRKFQEQPGGSPGSPEPRLTFIRAR